VDQDAGRFVARLHEALDRYDEAGAERVVDEVLDRFALDAALDQVLMPFLVEVGTRWAAGDLSVTQEHFASHIVRSRLAMLGAEVSPADDAPTVVVACAPGERHDIAPLAFSILLRREGWQVRYLGADTPMTDLAFACRRIQPDLVVVAASRASAMVGGKQGLRRIAARSALAIAGAGASRELAQDLGAVWLEGDVNQGARRAVEVLRDQPTG
jgi:methanogenic corrinoid protein MtbC1